MLFDYESNDYTLSSLTISKSGSFIRNERKIAFIPGISYVKNNNNKNNIALLHVNHDDFRLCFDERERDSSFNIKNSINSLNTEKAWMIIRTTYCKHKNVTYLLIVIGLSIKRRRNIKDRKSRFQSKGN